MLRACLSGGIARRAKRGPHLHGGEGRARSSSIGPRFPEFRLRTGRLRTDVDAFPSNFLHVTLGREVTGNAVWCVWYVSGQAEPLPAAMRPRAVLLVLEVQGPQTFPEVDLGQVRGLRPLGPCEIGRVQVGGGRPGPG